jgi:hypothetical protein
VLAAKVRTELIVRDSLTMLIPGTRMIATIVLHCPVIVLHGPVVILHRMLLIFPGLHLVILLVILRGLPFLCLRLFLFPRRLRILRRRLGLLWFCFILLRLFLLRGFGIIPRVLSLQRPAGRQHHSQQARAQ